MVKNYSSSHIFNPFLIVLYVLRPAEARHILYLFGGVSGIGINLCLVFLLKSYLSGYKTGFCPPKMTSNNKTVQ